MPWRFKLLTTHAVAPKRASPGAAGHDLSAAYAYTVPKRGKELIKTDLRLYLPAGTYGRVAPRSGLAWKHSIDVGAGVIDLDYEGNVGVVLFNHGDQDFHIKAGDRIAQLIVEKIDTTDAVEFVESKDVDSNKEKVESKSNEYSSKPLIHVHRGANGFGSSGV